MRNPLHLPLLLLAALTVPSLIAQASALLRQEPLLRAHMASRLKVVEPTATELAPPSPIDFVPAPTRKRHAGWTAEKQRKFIERLALTGSAGQASAAAGVASSSAYRLRNKAGADSFAAAWDAAMKLAATRGAAIAWDRGLNGRVERYYKDGELVMERRIPSDYLLTWLLSRIDPLQFGSPTGKALAAATGDPRDRSRQSLPELTASLTDVATDECPVESGDYLDERLGEVS